MLRSISYSFRLLYIGALLWPALKRGRLSSALERLGPSFIKLGQVLSTRPDLIGIARAHDLANLRDKLPPFPTKDAKRIIFEELGATTEQIFLTFEDTPVAAASVAQVHKATLPGGAAVAVKIIRPGVEKAFARDIALFAWAARLLMRRLPEYRRLKLVEVVDTLRESIHFELDLRYEAAAMEEMRGHTRQDAGLHIPRVEWALTAQRVLVTEWVEGVPVHEVAALRATGHSPNHVLAQLAEHFFLHVFRDGFFHADLHPGNIFVNAAGELVLVDFGIMGRLNPRERLYMADIFHGFLQEDYARVAEAHFRAGYVPAHQSRERFAQAAMAIAKPIFNRPASEISLARLLEQLFSITETFEMETQPQLLLLQKTLVVVEGVGRMLNPQVNMWEMARAPIEAWAAGNLGPRGKAKHAAWELRELLRQWPQIMRKLEEALGTD